MEVHVRIFRIHSERAALTKDSRLNSDLVLHHNERINDYVQYLIFKACASLTNNLNSFRSSANG